jgi:hypothetical protein
MGSIADKRRLETQRRSRLSATAFDWCQCFADPTIAMRVDGKGREHPPTCWLRRTRTEARPIHSCHRGKYLVGQRCLAALAPSDGADAIFISAI